MAIDKTFKASMSYIVEVPIIGCERYYGPFETREAAEAWVLHRGFMQAKVLTLRSINLEIRQ